MPLQARDVLLRDVAGLEARPGVHPQAVDEFQALLEYYPFDARVSDAEAKIRELNTKLARKIYESGVIYIKMEYYGLPGSRSTRSSNATTTRRTRNRLCCGKGKSCSTDCATANAKRSSSVF